MRIVLAMVHLDGCTVETVKPCFRSEPYKTRTVLQNSVDGTLLQALLNQYMLENLFGSGGYLNKKKKQNIDDRSEKFHEGLHAIIKSQS